MELNGGNRLSNQRYKWDYTMRKHVLPRIGSVPVTEVTARQAAAIASAMIDTPSAAKFALSCIERVCQWAIDSGHREKANPASGPKRQINVPPPTHATFLPVGEVEGALAKIDASDSSEAVKLSVRFTALTAQRLCEVRRAMWDEIDLEARTWTIPGRSNAKIKEDSRRDDPADDAAGGIEASPHGFRSTFRAWAQECGENWEAVEISLSHTVGSSVVESYARSDMLALRRDLMERDASELGLGVK